MTTERVDPRVRRTRLLLQDALLTLARGRDLDEISVADVAEYATVNRSTFYQHYADKDTLLADALDERAARVGADLAALTAPARGNGRDRTAILDAAPDVLARYTRHVSENADLYRRALGEGGSLNAITRLRRRITSLALEACRVYGTPEQLGDLPEEVAAAALTGSLLGVLTAWLEIDPLPDPDDAARWAWLALTREPPRL
jgi:AcrR family transcriptional regulator